MAERKGGDAIAVGQDSTSDWFTGARSPEELETLLEDALLSGDHDALVDLFEEGAVLAVAGELPARRVAAIAELALATWHGDRSYVADPRQVIQARDVALVVTEWGANVARRGKDGAWRYAIVRQPGDDETEDGHDIGSRSSPGTETSGRCQGRG